jgi:hypothetical protein
MSEACIGSRNDRELSTRTRSTALSECCRPPEAFICIIFDPPPLQSTIGTLCAFFQKALKYVSCDGDDLPSVPFEMMLPWLTCKPAAPFST